MSSTSTSQAGCPNLKSLGYQEDSPLTNVGSDAITTHCSFTSAVGLEQETSAEISDFPISPEPSSGIGANGLGSESEAGHKEGGVGHEGNGMAHGKESSPATPIPNQESAQSEATADGSSLGEYIFSC